GSRNDIDRSEFLAWVHAPDRLPKFLILIPSAALKRAVFSAGSFKILSNLEALRAAEGLKAWRFESSRIEDLARQVRDPRPTRMNAREALAELEAEVRGAEGARR